MPIILSARAVLETAVNDCISPSVDRNWGNKDTQLDNADTGAQLCDGT